MEILKNVRINLKNVQRSAVYHVQQQVELSVLTSNIIDLQNSKMYTITHIFNLNVNISFYFVKGAAITTKISLSGKTNDIGNNSETIETTDTTKKIDDQKTDPSKNVNRQSFFDKNKNHFGINLNNLK